MMFPFVALISLKHTFLFHAEMAIAVYRQTQQEAYILTVTNDRSQWADGKSG